MGLHITLERQINIPQVPVYLDETYQDLFSRYDKCEYRYLKLIDKSGGAIFLPLLLNSPTEGYFEGYSAYGYGGFYSSDYANEDMEQILSANWNQLANFMCREKIYSIFLRHSPFLDNHGVVNPQYNHFNRITYSRNLKPYDSWGAFTTSLPQKLRWSVNYALKHGYTVEFENNSEKSLIEFYSMYAELMNAKNASEYYLFSYDFIKQHFHCLGARIELGVVKQEKTNQIVAAALFLLDNEMAHYHLSAGKTENRKFQTMQLLLASAIYRYGNNNKKLLNLGGGHTKEGTDGLSQFKKKFSDAERPFIISKIVFDKDKYRMVRQDNDIEDSSMFLIRDALKSR